MPTFTVYGTIYASIKLGTVEAATQDEAQELADGRHWDMHPSLCSHCRSDRNQNLELGDGLQDLTVVEGEQ